MGTFGQKCFTSGVHFSGIFSIEDKNQRSVLSENEKESVIKHAHMGKEHKDIPKRVSLPKLSGLSIEKHMRMTSVSGYERGRSLS